MAMPEQAQQIHLTPDEALRQMGLQSFRGIQADVVAAVLSGRDAMVLMATSGGKSLCYTVPALCLPGYAVVVSPLLALMDDQKAGMEARGVRAAIVRGGQSWAEREEIFADADAGRIKIVLMPPELLASGGIIDLLARTRPRFFAFDEAHCISTWGQDFRPTYADVGRNLDSLEAQTGERVQRVCLTATASARTVADIKKLAGLREPQMFSASLARENLSVFVRHADSQAAIDAEIVNDVLFFGPDKAGIVYCRTRKECERIGALLLSRGVRASVHHSGIPMLQRQDIARNFMAGHTSVMVATIGFGMGIDKSDIRYVLHSGVSPTPEAWYQEIGRAGRDGKQAVAVTYAKPLSTIVIREGSMRREDGWGAALDYAHVLYGSECRMKAVLKCFDEDVAACGKCDCCLGLSPASVPAVSAGAMLQAARERPGKTVKFYAKAAGGLHPLVAQTATDSLFLSQYVDFDTYTVEGRPPISSVAMTAEGLGADVSSIALQAPRRVSVPALELEIGPVKKLSVAAIALRVGYFGQTLSPEWQARIREGHQSKAMLRGIPGVSLPEHLLPDLAPADIELSEISVMPARNRKIRRVTIPPSMSPR